MQQNNSLKVIVTAAIALFVLVWIIWINLGQSSQAETVKAESKSVQGSVVQPIPEQTSIATLPNQQYQNDFAAAVRLINTRPEQAEQQFRRLIKQNPEVIEAYINLSSIVAKQGKIQESTDILRSGVEANPTTALAFNNLQQLHGALAAQAYQNALLETEKRTTVKPEMKISSVANLKQPSEEAKAAKLEIEQFKRQLAQRDKQISESEAKLAAANQNLSRLTEQANQNSSKFQTQVAEQDKSEKTIALLRQQLADAKQRLQKTKTDYDSQIATLNQKLQSQQVSSVAINTRPVLESKPAINYEATLIAKVKSWAKAWSNQDVNRYIAHYKNDYRPASGVSNKVWRQQRQVRLTNKTFIKVDVSNFSFKSSKGKVTVSFTQHYKSNTMDDTIRKQLVFEAHNSSWENAKISAERVVR